MSDLTPWTIVIDTREQTPFVFDIEPAKGVAKPHIFRSKLDVGDYQPVHENDELPLVVERKTKMDLYASVTRGRERFEREMERAIEQHLALHIVVECSFMDLNTPPGQSSVKPKVVYHTLFSWAVRYGISVWAPGSRAMAEACAYRLMEFAVRGQTVKEREHDENE